MPREDQTAGKALKKTVKAVIPAAGLGTRFHPLTLAVPKEMLPVNRKPLIQWAVEEAIASGISDIAIVTRKGKEVIRDYLLRTFAIPCPPRERPSTPEAKRVHLHFIIQKRPLGLGNAVYEAREFINACPFVMVIPDQILVSETPGTKQVLDAAQSHPKAVWSSLVRVNTEAMRFFNGARSLMLKHQAGRTWKIDGFREIDQGTGNHSFLAFGRTYFPPGVSDYFSTKFLNPTTKEVDLLPTFSKLFTDLANYGVLLDGEPMDVGTWEGYEHFFPILAASPLHP